MTAPKDPSAYPPQFFDILNRVSPGSNATLILPTLREARGIRFRWFYFLAALKRAAEQRGEYTSARTMANGITCLLKPLRADDPEGPTEISWKSRADNALLVGLQLPPLPLREVTPPPLREDTPPQSPPTEPDLEADLTPSVLSRLGYTPKGE